MKVQDLQGRLFQLGLIGEVPTGNLLWVDPVNGRDELGVRERLTVPFRRLGAAKAMAQAGDTIIVLPGTYNENDLAKDGVNWHFLPGARVEYSSTSTAAIFDTASISGGAKFKITGSGVFKTSSPASGEIFALDQSGDEITAEFDSMDCIEDAVYLTSGVFRATGRLVKAYAKALRVGGSAQAMVRVRELISTHDTAVEINGSTAVVEVEAYRIHSESSGYGLLFVTADRAHISAYELKADAGWGVWYASPGSKPLHLNVARIVSNYNSTSGEAVRIAVGTNALFLYGCKLITNSQSAANSIDSTSATTVVAMGQCIGKFAKGANVTFAPIGFVQDSRIA